MNIQTYTKDNFFEMDPMHDCTASQILMEDNSLVVIYNDLDEDVFDVDGAPLYNYKTVKIQYNFKSFCDVELYDKKRKCKLLNMLNEKSAFDKLTDKCRFVSYKYSVDSFGQMGLYFSMNDICRPDVVFYLDTETVTYYWE